MVMVMVMMNEGGGNVHFTTGLFKNSNISPIVEASADSRARISTQLHDRR